MYLIKLNNTLEVDFISFWHAIVVGVPRVGVDTTSRDLGYDVLLIQLQLT